MKIKIIKIILNIMFILKGIFINGFGLFNLRILNNIPNRFNHNFLNILKLILLKINRINIRKCFGCLLFLSITNLLLKILLLPLHICIIIVYDKMEIGRLLGLFL